MHCGISGALRAASSLLKHHNASKEPFPVELGRELIADGERIENRSFQRRVDLPKQEAQLWNNHQLPSAFQLPPNSHPFDNKAIEDSLLANCLLPAMLVVR